MTLLSEVVLREEDVEECRAGGFTPQEAVEQSIRLSTESFVCRGPDGEILAYWGYREDSLISGRCSVWMLSTPDIEFNQRFFARESRRITELLLATHFQLICLVDVNYVRAVRWLEWLGYEPLHYHGRFVQMRITRGGAA